MLPDPRFSKLDKMFWANVRSISQQRGYTVRSTTRTRAVGTAGQIKVYSVEDMVAAMGSLGLDGHHIFDPGQAQPTTLATTLRAYFRHRADVLNMFVAPRLMTAERAKQTFEGLRSLLDYTKPVPLNKQSGDKRVPAYLTGIVNMLIEANCHGQDFAHDPKALTTFTRGGLPLRTLARRVDGCFPSTVNPIAMWEIKEYYYTTTFGSRVADGVYETLLDGLELEELREHEGIDTHHLLMVDSYQTWWSSGGRPYLCRLVDALHMGYIDEVLFGYEVVERIPGIVAAWLRVQASGR